MSWCRTFMLTMLGVFDERALVCGTFTIARWYQLRGTFRAVERLFSTIIIYPYISDAPKPTDLVLERKTHLLKTKKCSEQLSC